MNSLSLIGFSGRIGAGKTTAAKILEPRGFIRMSFGNYLKDMLLSAGLDHNQVYGPLEVKERSFYWKVDDPWRMALSMLNSLNVDIRNDLLNVPSNILNGCTPRIAAEKLLSSGVVPKEPGTIFTTPRHIMQLLGTEWGRSLHPDFWTRLMEVDFYPLLKNGKKIVIDDVRFNNEVDLIHKHGGKIIGIVFDDSDSKSSHVSEAGVTPDTSIFNERKSIEVLDNCVKNAISLL